LESSFLWDFQRTAKLHDFKGFFSLLAATLRFVFPATNFCI